MDLISEDQQPTSLMVPVYNANRLPVTLEDHISMAIMAQAAVKAHIAKVSALESLDASVDLRKKALENGQAAAEFLFHVVKRIGQFAIDDYTLTSSEAGKEKGKRVQGDNTLSKSTGNFAQILGTTRTWVENAKLIARHPEFIEEVIEEARLIEDIPSLTRLITLIRDHKKHMKQLEEESEKKTEEESEEEESEEEESEEEESEEEESEEEEYGVRVYQAEEYQAQKSRAKDPLAKTVHECSVALHNANSYMVTVISGWEIIPDEEKQEFIRERDAFLGHVQRLLGEFPSPDPDNG